MRINNYCVATLGLLTVFSTLFSGCAPSSTLPPLSSSNPRTYGEWTAAEFGGGGFVQDVLIQENNPLIMHMHTDVGGLYRSEDGGKRWRMLHGGLPATAGVYCVRGMIADPADDKILLAGMGNQWAPELGIFRSTDAGQTWTQVLQAQFYGNGPQRSDGRIMDVHPSQPDRVIAGSAGTGIWITEDKGLTWALHGLVNVNICHVLIDHLHPNRIWVSAKPWKPWKKEDLQGGFYRSEDGGKTWTQLAESGPTEIFQSADGQRLLGLFDYSFIKTSIDHGSTWEDYTEGLPLNHEEGQKTVRSHYRFKALSGGPDFHLAATTRGDIYRRGFNDSAWTKIPFKGAEELYEGSPWHGRMEPGKWQHFGSALCSLVVHPENPDEWFFTDWYAIYRSIDAGETWALSMDGVEVTVIHELTQDPSDSGRVHLGMADNGSCISLDGGERFDSHHICSNMKSISLSDAQPNRVYGTGDGGGGRWAAEIVFLSIDAGTTWQRAPMNGLPIGEENLFNTIAVDPSNPYHVFVAASGKTVHAGDGGPYESYDGGKTWIWMGHGLPTSESFFRKDIWRVGPELAISSNGSKACISYHKKLVYYQVPGDSHWQVSSFIPENKPNHIVADPFSPDRFYMGVANMGVYQSDDGGKTWKLIFSTNPSRLAVDRVTPGRIAVSTQGAVFYSTDSGAIWTETDRSLPFRTGGILCFAGDRLLVGSDGSGTFWLPLTPNAKAKITAHQRKAIYPPHPDVGGKLPELQNLDFTQGETYPQGWRDPWTDTGTIFGGRDESEFQSKPHALVLTGKTPDSYGSIIQPFTAVTTPFELSGTRKSSGTDLKEAQLALKVNDANGVQIDWIQICNAVGHQDWKTFKKRIQLNDNASSAELSVVIKGEGSVWIDDLLLSPSHELFPTGTEQ